MSSSSSSFVSVWRYPATANNREVRILVGNQATHRRLESREDLVDAIQRLEHSDFDFRVWPGYWVLRWEVYNPDYEVWVHTAVIKTNPVFSTERWREAGIDLLRRALQALENGGVGLFTVGSDSDLITQEDFEFLSNEIKAGEVGRFTLIGFYQ